MWEEKEQNYDISIIVPTFNNTHYIDECISSLMESSSGLSYEILIGIDGCQKTYDHIKNKLYPENIKIFYFKENKGPYLIKNSLLNIASSENILFFDSDDVILKGSISFLNNLSNDFDVIKFRLVNFVGDFNVNNVKGKSMFAEGVFFIKKSLFLSMNGFEPWMCAADSDFMSRLYKKKLKIHFTNEILFYRRIHSENLTKREDTGLGSKLRTLYWEISKNKKGDGNPQTLSISEFVPILYYKPGDGNSQTLSISELAQILSYKPIEDKTYVESEEELQEKYIRELRKESLDKVFNHKNYRVKTPVEKIEKKVSSINYEKINNLLNNKVIPKPIPKVKQVTNTPENKKIITNKEMVKLNFPGKKNRRSNDPTMTFFRKINK
jgi:glycosyltransferase involved in cell wall biosynthesis